MLITCTFPGKHGDLLWALPTMRAIAEAAGHPIDLVISPFVRSLAPLLRLQPYLGQVIVDEAWGVQQTAPLSPRTAPSYPDAVHLGYEGWPTPDLPRDIYERASYTMLEDHKIALPLAPDLDRPWITVPPSTDPSWGDVVCGWSDEYFELKYGITDLIFEGRPEESTTVLAAPGSRWTTEGGWTASDWIEAAQAIASAKVFLGCCSALHVLAVATGTPAVIMEPAEARWHDVFWPLGKTGRVQLVLGGDGRPTFDARHVADAIRGKLAGDFRGIRDNRPGV